MKDSLNRQSYLDLLKSIIANQCDNPAGYSFAIDGEWGAGKSWILQELEKQLLEGKDNKYLIFHYNAWENDFDIYGSGPYAIEYRSTIIDLR